MPQKALGADSEPTVLLELRDLVHFSVLATAMVGNLVAWLKTQVQRLQAEDDTR